MKIIPLSEGSFTVDHTKHFIPFHAQEHELRQRTPGSLLVEIQPFAIITLKDILLLDTGLGFYTEQGVLQLHQNLINNGINPQSVTKVLISHLHKDHTGGISMLDAFIKERRLSFPNAIYYVNKNEFEQAVHKKSSSYNSEHFGSLEGAQNVCFCDDKGIIDGYIHYEVTGGHSPYHQSFFIEENNQKIFFGADVAPQLQQMKSRFIAKYDFDGKKSMELRQLWWQQGHAAHWTFLFYHDIKSPVFSF